MALRVVRLDIAFHTTLERFGVSRDPKQRAAVGRIVGRLEGETLPAPSDVATHVTVLPTPGPAWSRRVGGYQLWLVFRFDEMSVTVLGVTPYGPVPL